MKFGEKLKKIRKRKGLTLKQLADKVGVTEGYLCHIENDRRENPSIDKIEKIAKALNTNPVNLLIKKENWQQLLPEELKEFVKKENIEYLEVISQFKKEGFSPDEIKNIINVLKNISKKN